MARTYYSATDGHITVFRATAERVYRSAWFQSTLDGTGQRVRTGGISFSATGFSGARISFQHPVTEITQADYETLVAAKKRRTSKSSPQHSWVANADLTTGATA